MKRRVIYVGTGNAYSEPAAESSDAILALDLTTRRIRWACQMTPDDVFVPGYTADRSMPPARPWPVASLLRVSGYGAWRGQQGNVLLAFEVGK